MDNSTTKSHGEATQMTLPSILGSSQEDPSAESQKREAMNHRRRRIVKRLEQQISRRQEDLRQIRRTCQHDKLTNGNYECAYCGATFPDNI